MNSLISQMISKYQLQSKEDYVNALKEVVQEIALSALARSDFFDHAAFYGGTALRIFYGLDRFSEDLDFSLIEKKDFDLSKYFKILEDTFKLYGFSFKAQIKDKTKMSNIQSAFLKGNTLEHIMLIEANHKVLDFIQKEEVIKIKLEIDINPPSGATYEFKYGLFPYPYKVRVFDQESLFAGKIHALLCRDWKQRVKGRDLYDYLFYISNKINPNLTHLKERLIESKKWVSSKEFTLADLKELLLQRFEEINYEQAKEDVISFIAEPSKLDLWSEEFFKAVTNSWLNGHFFGKTEKH